VYTNHIMQLILPVWKRLRWCNRQYQILC